MCQCFYCFHEVCPVFAMKPKPLLKLCVLIFFILSFFTTSPEIIPVSQESQLVEIIANFYPCFINIVNFKRQEFGVLLKQLHSAPQPAPFMYNDGLESLKNQIFIRKSLFCVINIMLFPEKRQPEKFGNKSWIPLVLFRTAPHYDVYLSSIYDRYKNILDEELESFFIGFSQQLVEQHFLLVVTEKVPSMFYSDITTSRTDFIQSIFILRVDTGLAQNLLSFTYICLYCQPRYGCRNSNLSCDIHIIRKP